VFRNPRTEHISTCYFSFAGKIAILLHTCTPLFPFPMRGVECIIQICILHAGAPQFPHLSVRKIRGKSSLRTCCTDFARDFLFCLVSNVILWGCFALVQWYFSTATFRSSKALWSRLENRWLCGTVSHCCHSQGLPEPYLNVQDKQTRMPSSGQP
jgi:hypothetical protein